MARTFRILGRMARRASQSRAFDRAIVTASGYLVSELQAADIRLRLAYLKRKRTDHLHLLGKTAFRLHVNEVDLKENEHIARIVSVLTEINLEIERVEQELERRREVIKQRRNHEHQDHTNSGRHGDSGKNPRENF